MPCGRGLGYRSVEGAMRYKSRSDARAEGTDVFPAAQRDGKTFGGETVGLVVGVARLGFRWKKRDERLGRQWVDMDGSWSPVSASGERRVIQGLPMFANAHGSPVPASEAEGVLPHHSERGLDAVPGSSNRGRCCPAMCGGGLLEPVNTRCQTVTAQGQRGQR
jgi:hypothetical protein